MVIKQSLHYKIRLQELIKQFSIDFLRIMISESVKNALKITTGLVEIFFICGLVYGWGVFDYILKEENIYEELCNDEEQFKNGNTTSCDGQNKIFLQITSIGTFILSAGSLMIGSLLDR